MSAEVQTNFTSGALDPNLKGRIDVKHYYNGAEVMRNVSVSPQGGFSMREGLEWLDELPPSVSVLGTAPSAPEGLGSGAVGDIVDDDRTTTVQTNNNISTTDPYVVALWDLGAGPLPSIPFVILRGLGLTSGSSTQFEIQSSDDGIAWTTFADVPSIGTTAADFVLRAPNWPTRVVARYWRLARIGSIDLGTAKVNLADMLLMNWTGVSNCKMIPFEFSINDRYMMAVTDRVLSVYRDGVFQAIFEVVYLNAAIPALNWTQSLDTLLIVQEDNPPQLIQRQGSDTAWAIADQAFTKVPIHAFSPVTSNPAAAITPDVTDGTGKLTATAAVFLSTHVDQLIEGGGARVRITEFIDTTHVKYVTVFPFFNLDQILATDWVLTTGFEAAWSATRGWPRSITFHEARTVVGGSRDLPSNIWLSRVGLFFDFELGQFLDDDGIDVTIASDEQTIINNVVSGTTLQIFAAGREFYIPQVEDQPITPPTINVKRSTKRGSAPNIRAVSLGGETLFIQRQGRAVREFVFAPTDKKGYSAANISLLAAHLIKSPVAMASRATTDTNQADIVEIVNGDGTVATLTTLRDQDITAWVEADTPGGSGLFKCVAVDLDDIYFAIQRTINGASRLFLERFKDTLRADAGKCLTITGTTVAGLDHLEGETVKIVVDGALHADEVVSGGSIELDASVTNATVEVGLAYTWTVKDMPAVKELADGTRMDGKKRVIEQILQLKDTKDILVDGERPAFRTFGTGAASPLDAAIVPFTGRKRLEGRLGYDDEAQTTMTGEHPLPATVLSLEKRMIP